MSDTESRRRTLDSSIERPNVGAERKRNTGSFAGTTMQEEHMIVRWHQLCKRTDETRLEGGTRRGSLAPRSAASAVGCGLLQVRATLGGISSP
jgi:hypothetical protein